ncbi:Histone chaperone asf1 [Tulasnella sp. 403]|nr:Histone chaperone asf1 [Tulasnella sp. 403]
MSAVTIRNVEFLNNPARFLEPYKFRVTFECIMPLQDDLEWKLIYVSSPGQPEYDQELDDCMVGPVPVGVNSFEFESPSPSPSRIPPEDVLGVAAIILTASYKDQEFVRVGYYQNTEYDNEEMKETPPQTILFDRLVRELASKPKVTRFMIKWDTDNGVTQPPQQNFSTRPDAEHPRFGSGQSAFQLPPFGAPNGSMNYATNSAAVPPAHPPTH